MMLSAIDHYSIDRRARFISSLVFVGRWSFIASIAMAMIFLSLALNASTMGPIKALSWIWASPTTTLFITLSSLSRFNSWIIDCFAASHSFEAADLETNSPSPSAAFLRTSASGSFRDPVKATMALVLPVSQCCSSAQEAAILISAFSSSRYLINFAIPSALLTLPRYCMFFTLLAMSLPSILSNNPGTLAHPLYDQIADG